MWHARLEFIEFRDVKEKNPARMTWHQWHLIRMRLSESVFFLLCCHRKKFGNLLRRHGKLTAKTGINLVPVIAIADAALTLRFCCLLLHGMGYVDAFSTDGSWGENRFYVQIQIPFKCTEHGIGAIDVISSKLDLKSSLAGNLSAHDAFGSPLLAKCSSSSWD